MEFTNEPVPILDESADQRPTLLDWRDWLDKKQRQFGKKGEELIELIREAEKKRYWSDDRIKAVEIILGFFADDKLASLLAAVEGKLLDGELRTLKPDEMIEAYIRNLACDSQRSLADEYGISSAGTMNQNLLAVEEVILNYEDLGLADGLVQVGGFRFMGSSRRAVWRRVNSRSAGGSDGIRGKVSGNEKEMGRSDGEKVSEGDKVQEIELVESDGGSTLRVTLYLTEMEEPWIVQEIRVSPKLVSVIKQLLEGRELFRGDHIDPSQVSDLTGLFTKNRLRKLLRYQIRVVSGKRYDVYSLRRLTESERRGIVRGIIF